MHIVTLFFIISVISFVAFVTYQKSLVTRRQKLIDSYPFPQKISKKIRATYPHLNEQQTDEVISGLREYFHICNIAGHKIVAMPSQVVDVAWHEHILFTKQYAFFCRKALGRFLHHTPAEAMRTPTSAQEGIKRAWRIACLREGISTAKPNTLPRLFALDTRLKIPNGFKYALNCANSNAAYCGSHIGCASGCASGSDADSGSGSDSSSGDNDGCGSGCSGSGCGGGD